MKWTTNETYGGAVQGLDEHEIDLILTFTLLSTARMRYLSYITQTQQFL